MIKFVSYITLSITICLYSNLMAQDADSKQPSSHQITAADPLKSDDAKSPNDKGKSKPLSGKPQNSKPKMITGYEKSTTLHKLVKTYIGYTLKEELGTIRMLGSPEIQNLPVSLLDAFVSLDISETWRSEGQNDPRKKAGMQTADRSFPPETVIQKAFRRYRMMLIIGEPGSGKTTLLKYYAMCCLIEKRYQELGFKKPVYPIYFPLRELEPDDTYPAAPAGEFGSLGDASWA